MTTAGKNSVDLVVDAGRMSRAESVAHVLGQQILDGDLVPGQRLGTRTELSQTYGVAAGTLNQVIRLLETRGLVIARPGQQGGIFVAAPPAHVRLGHLILALGDEGLSVADSLEIRDALEAPVALGAMRVAGAADIRRLRTLVRRMGGCAEDPNKYLAHNWALHQAIAELGSNRLLRAIYGSLLDAARSGVLGVEADDSFRASWRDNWQLHVDLVEAIDSRDESRVLEAAAAHRPLGASSTTEFAAAPEFAD